ncbi:MAG: hypothetical protein EXX96DRAFT_53394 [Benjaminiella poitrasii]|nr:MAG: hypothetical protein EXX96DRAFT_53394 [Benjaminiella poitrasii]
MTTLQVYAHRLSDPSLAPGLKVTIANELRDQVEVFQTLEYSRFLATLIPVFIDIFQNGTPIFQSNVPEQKLRNIILEIIYRLPQTEILKEYVPDLCKMLMHLLRVENEDNGVVCVKIITDLHRTYRHLLEDQVQPFLDIVQEIFKNMEQTVKDVFDAPCTPIGSATPGLNPLLSNSPRPNSPPATELPETPPKPLPKSMFSFKVLTECPIITVLLFQTHRRYATENIIKFVPLIFQILNLQAKPQAEAASAAQARGEVFVGVSSEIRNRSVYNDFIVAQVKTMSFLAYILRSYTAFLRPFQNQIPEFVLRLLRECPPESSATRKELLVATRHILSTDFRTSFVSKIDLLLNEKVLIGTGVTSYDTLRPLAYSMLADLVHHIRSELSPNQLCRTVYIYTRNLHDSTLAPSIQTMCGKLLLNLIDCIIKIPNRKEGRDLFMRILDAFASKFASLNIQFKSCLYQHNKKNQTSGKTKPVTETKPDKDAKGKSTKTAETMKNDEFDFDNIRSIHTPSYVLDPQQDGIKDGRFLFKNLTIGLKPLFIGLRHSNAPPTNEINPQYYAQFARGFSEDDVHIFIRLFRESLKCFEYYNIDHYTSNETHSNEENTGENSIGVNELSLKIGTQLSTEEEIMDTLSIVYTLLDPAVFQEIFASQMEFFFECMLVNTDLVHIAQDFLMNEVSSQGFASILFHFLMDRLERLGDEDRHYSALMLYLFRLAFMAVNLFPDANEEVLQPYLANLVTSCFKLSSKAKEPANYFLLLRALFKSIGGGRFELLYKEIHPLLQFLLENLNSLLALAHRSEMRNLFVELCLAVPVRLSALLPFLPYLMRPLVIALQADNELVTQGLRTLELCHDNLNPEFLNQVMAPVMQELMEALWNHLQPLPYNQQHSHIAMRILGKLGGKNRRVLINPPELEFNKRIESGVSVEILFDPNSAAKTLPLDKCLEIACRTLEKQDADIFHKKHAYEFLKANVILMLDLEEGSSNLAQSLYQRVKQRLSQTTVNTEDKMKEAEKLQSDTSVATDMDIDKTTANTSIGGENTIVGDTLKKHGLKPERFVGNGYTKYQAKRVAQEESLCTILIAIMKASILPGTADDARPLFENICRHFMLLHIGEAIEAKETENKPLSDMVDEKLLGLSLNTTILVDAVVKVITSLDPKLRKCAEEVVLFCYDIAVKILGGKEYVWQLPIFRVFASQFGSCCYKQEWFNKRGGCLGISIISSQMDMGTKWMREHEIDFIRSLLFVLKDASPEMANINTAEATQTLVHVLKVCNGLEGDESQEAQQQFQTLIGLLLRELSNSNKTVRETVQSSFQLLADLTGNEVTELLAPVRERLVAPIFAKPLRALPFAMQIGHIDAITYCLTLRPPFLEFNDELIRLLHEALAIADAEDQALVSRSSQYKNATSLINLRIVCIRLLSAAMACSDFSNQRQPRTCTRIIQVFFKSLYSKSPEVVEAAHRGLKQVLAQQYKLPKELLQQGLRPILTTLSNYKTLSVAGLEGLARLLELLTNYFKVEIGNKLLDHLRQWADPAVLHETAEKNLYENHEVKIIVAILNIFHLLPAAAHIFLDGLVSSVVNMEGHLRRSISSPFRPNLIKFLCRYPAETIAYFYERLDQPRYSSLFIDILGVETAGSLRDEVIKSPATLVEKTFSVADNPNMHYQGVLIVREVSAYDSEWLVNSTELMKNLLKLWRIPSRFEAMKNDGDQGLRMTRETMYLAQIFISYLRLNPDDIDVTYEIAALFAQESIMDLTFLRGFFLHDVALTYSAKRKRLILERFLQQYSDASISSYWRMMVLRHVVNPALLVTLYQNPESCDDIFDAKIIEQLDIKIWKQLGPSSVEDDQYAEDSLRIELLQLTAMIVQYVPQYLTDLRKEIIKFGWHYLRLEDVTCKQAAYVLIARFITAFETPSKIVIQIYAALLRAHSSEARPLVKQGLDIITPVLPKRVALVGNEKIPTWIRLTRKVVVEDTHSISQMVNVYQLLVRHPDMFYDYREHFLPQIVNALPKLSLIQNATPENKLLCVELSELLLSWERQRLGDGTNKNEDETTTTTASGKRSGEPLANSPNKKPKSENAENKSTTSASPDVVSHGKDYEPPLALRDNTIGCLVRLACGVYNPSDMIHRRLVQRVLELIKQFLDSSVWPDVNIKFAHLERALTVKDMNDILASSVCSALEILNIDISHKTNEWYIVNMNQLFRLLETSIKSDNVRVHTSLQLVLSHIFRSINSTINVEKGEETLHPDVAGFASLVESTVTDGMTSMNNIYGVFKLLQAFSTGRIEQLDPFIPGMVKMLQKLTKEHITSPHTSSTAPDSLVNLLILGLGLLKKRISYLGDQRRYFLTCLIQLIEKSPDVQLLHTIMDMLREWTLDRKEAFPTIKEKAGLLVKMMSIESRNDTQLTEDFLDLVIKIYSNPSFARSELTVRLEQAFLFGTCNENPQIRIQFMRVFDRSISRTLYTRLHYILGIQNWESLADTFWIHQALDMLFGAVKVNPQTSVPHTLKIKSIKSIGDQGESMEIDVPNEVNEIISQHQLFLKNLQEYDTNNVIFAVRHLQYLDANTAFRIWVDLFPMCWSILSGTEKHDMVKVMINLLAKEYHNKQIELRPNVIQALLTGIANTGAGLKLPPHLIKYLGKTHNAWHTAIEILQQFSMTGRINDSSKDDINNHERTLDALSELYDNLEEKDMFYGLWRRRSTYTETNVAVSYEQSGLWSQAQKMYENAQTKARSGVLPFSESEYLLWENHWIACSQKLQQWDILIDLAKHDNNTSLLLDCAWRLSNWAAEREVLEQAISQVSGTPTSRLKAMEAFLILIKSQLTDDRLAEFSKACEEGVQLSLKKWHGLPHIVSQSHLPLLQVFQQYLELHESSQIFASLVNTNIQNFEQRSNELRTILGSWRERMPNPWDDIDVWSDIVAWRQHIFNAINHTYMHLIPMIPAQLNQAALQGGNPFAYRGYHELSWIINRFAHVARKHHLNDVCLNNLTKLYTLPTIDTNEVFYKMREQVKCYYEDPNQLTAGLDIINNTNLGFFNAHQKAEFFGMKGQFLSKLQHYNEANEAFVNAVQMELSLPGAWAEWGKYNDKRFKENPNDLSWANNAVSCYLQAAGIYKDAKARKYLLRVLWLLSLDDENGTVSRAFEGYKGEWPVWFWITFIPQLLMGLHQREAKHARAILIRIAKQYPQALYFQLRTAKEDMLKRANNANASIDPAAKTDSPTSNIVNNLTPSITPAASTSNDGKSMQNENEEVPATKSVVTPTETTGKEDKATENNEEESAKTPTKESQNKDDKTDAMDVDPQSENKPIEVKSEDVKPEGNNETSEPSSSSQVKKEEDTEKGNDSSTINTSANIDVTVTDNTNTKSTTENISNNSKIPSPIVTDTTANVAASNDNSNTPVSEPAVTSSAIPNTANPLDEIMAMLKTGYPLLALSMETMVDQIQIKFKAQPDEDMYRVVVILYNDGLRQILTRLTNPDDTLQLTNTTFSSIARFANSLYPGHLKDAFVRDFVSSKMDLEEYVAKLRVWRDKFEAMLYARPRKQKLESASRYLVEFQHQKFDDVEIPGQYLLLKDNANNFARIDRFLPEVEITHNYGNYSRRLTIRGHDGSLHPFIIQNPSARQNRREERLMQLYRILNGVLERKKDSRIRSLGFHLPAIVPLAPNVRIIEDDPSYNTLYDIYEDYCDEVSMHKDYPLSFYVEKFKNGINKNNSNAEQMNLKMEINEEIGKKLVPSNILSKYMLRILDSYTDYWMHRKRFIAQYATATFMCYLFNIERRLPHKIMISCKTGNIYMKELHLGWDQSNYMLRSEDAIPFRFTPNIQDYVTPVGIEGPFSSSLMATARCLTEPELELDQYISLFIRDDLISWHTSQPQLNTKINYRELVQANVTQIMAKAQLLSCRTENEKETNTEQPINQNIIDLISQASNPQNMANMDCTWMPWL